MPMNDAKRYWSPLFELRNKLGCWVRMRWRDDTSFYVSEWRMILLMPVDGYLEGPDGPIRLRDVEWVEVATSLVSGGQRKPMQIIDIKNELLSGLLSTQIKWELIDSMWSMERSFKGELMFAFKDEPVQVVRIVNPFFESQPGRF